LNERRASHLSGHWPAKLLKFTRLFIAAGHPFAGCECNLSGAFRSFCLEFDCVGEELVLE
jgi:hypothetical protein